MSSRGLTAYEKETIIIFNQEESIGYIFTHEKTWQKHLERKLGLKPTMNNGFGGKEYQLPKSMIKPPRAPRRLSGETKKRLAEQIQLNRTAGAQNLVAVGNMGNPRPQCR